MEQNILVVGGAGVVGQAAISACRLVFGDDAYIIATSTKRQHIAGAHESVALTLTRDNIKSRDWIKPLLQDRPYTMTFFTPAFASSVGLPANEVTAEQRQEAFDFTVAPFLDMDVHGGFGTLVGFSSPWEIPIIQKVYGGLVSAKSELEKFCLEEPARRQVFRLGAVESKLLRGLAAMILRRWRSRPNELSHVFSHTKDMMSGPISQALLSEVIAQEHEYCGSTQPTTKLGIAAYIADWLRERGQGIRNLVGEVSWIGRHQRPLRLIPVTEWDSELVHRFVELHRNFCMLPG